jgi:hypothetical protein
MKTRKVSNTRNQTGQALVEYILMLSFAITLVILIQTGLRRSTFGLWKSFTCDIAAACPKCPYTATGLHCP